MHHARKFALAAASLLLGASASAGEREWVLARSRNFVVVSDAGAAKARQVAHQFEQVRGLFAQVLQARVDPGRLVVVFAVRDEDGLRELLPGHPWTKGGRLAGVFIPGRDKHLVALRLDTTGEHPYHVVYHEYTHLLTHLNVRWLPVWLSEGLAEFYGTADVDDKEVRWGRVYPPHVLYLRGHSSLDLQELMTADRQSAAFTHEASTPKFYAQAAIVTHYLLVGAPERRGQVARFLKLIESGEEETAALSDAFGDPHKLLAELNAYVRRETFLGMKTPARIDPQAITVGPLTPAQASALRGDFLARTGELGRGRALLEEALRQDPSLSWAEEGLGNVADFPGDRKEALGHFLEAVRLAPENYVALFRAGRIPDPSLPPATDAARREQLLRRALHANPAFAPALEELATLIASRPERVAEAVDLARQACALDPSTVTHRIALWNALARAGRSDEAARVEEDLQRAAMRDTRALDRMVDVLEGLDRPAETDALLARAYAGDKQNWALALRLGHFLHEHGRGEEAVAVLRDGVAAAPPSERLMLTNDLAFALAEQPGKAQEALDLIDDVLKKDEALPMYLHTRGWVLFHLSRLDEAEALLRTCADGATESEVFEHLADVLQAQGRTPEALAQYERALSASDVTDRQRAAIRKKVDALRAPSARP